MVKKRYCQMSIRIAALFPVDMGNYERNPLSVRETFTKLNENFAGVKFMAFHWRRSGNFLFEDSGEDSLAKAKEIGERVLDLACLVRPERVLKSVDENVPVKSSTTKGGSVVLPTSSGLKKVIYVALSDDVTESNRFIGSITSRVEVLNWVSPKDALCLYDRPGKGGDVGEVTNAVLKKLHLISSLRHIKGTGRALSVIQDILHGRNLRGR